MLLQKYSNFLIFAYLAGGMNFFIHAEQKKMIVAVPVADLRGKINTVPEGLVKGPALSNDIGSQHTQLLLGECLLGEEIFKQPGWVKVKALEQKMYAADGRSVAFVGYILKKDVCHVKEFPVYNLITKKLRIPVYLSPKRSKNAFIYLFLGTKLEGQKEENRWYRVMLPDGRFGYVLSEDVYPLTEEVLESVELLRSMIVSVSNLCIGCPYVWGGRSYSGRSDEGFITGLDCSGLANLIYRVLGLQIPRNSHDQFLASQPVASGSLLQPGDVIFLARQRSQGMRVYHVMLYVGNGMLLEATGNPDGLGVSKVADSPSPKDLVTRLISAQDFFGKPLEDIKNHDLCESGHRKGSVIYLGTFLASKEMIKNLRANELKRDTLVVA